MEILNIDAFAEPRRQLSFKGELYDVEEVDLQGFIDNLALAEELDKKGENTPRAQILMAIEVVKRSIPTLPDDKLRKLKPGQLSVVLSFIRGELDAKAIANSAAAPQEGASDEKKVT